MLEIEVERVLRVEINQSKVGIRYREFSEAELRTAIGHIVSGDLERGRGCMAIFLDDFISPHRDGTKLSMNVRRRKQFRRSEYQVIVFCAHPADFSGIDQLRDARSQQIHEPLNRQMCRLNLFTMHPNFALGSHRQRTFTLKGDVPGSQPATHLELAIVS